MVKSPGLMLCTHPSEVFPPRWVSPTLMVSVQVAYCLPNPYGAGIFAYAQKGILSQVTHRPKCTSQLALDRQRFPARQNLAIALVHVILFASAASCSPVLETPTNKEESHVQPVSMLRPPDLGYAHPHA